MTDSRITRACPICGETAPLYVQEEFDERLIQDAETGAFQTGEEGSPKSEYVHFVACDMCLCTAPLDAWNGTWMPTPAIQSVYRAYCAEVEAERVAA